MWVKIYRKLEGQLSGELAIALEGDVQTLLAGLTLMAKGYLW
jgi:hypothetical protein